MHRFYTCTHCGNLSDRLMTGTLKNGDDLVCKDCCKGNTTPLKASPITDMGKVPTHG